MFVCFLGSDEQGVHVSKIMNVKVLLKRFKKEENVPVKTM